jgi:phosphate transport system substrate-binding protein
MFREIGPDKSVFPERNSRRQVRILVMSARRFGGGHCDLDGGPLPTGPRTWSVRLQTASNFSVVQAGARLALYNLPTLLICVAFFLYFGRAADMPTSLTELVQVVGSESMRPTIEAIAEDFMTRNPLADITVRGGGSGDGIAALLHGMVDIAMTSRDVTPRERAYVGDKGLELSVVPLALDAVVVAVNRANPIRILDIEQIRDIFAGKIRNWHELQGAETEIVPLARAAGSGTAYLFGERVLSGESFAASVSHLSTNEAVVAELAARPGAIGYTGRGALRDASDRVRMIAIRSDQQSPATMATTESIVSGSYPLSRKLSLATTGHPTATAKAFVDFCLSANGQALFKRAGYIEIQSAVR